MGRGQSSIHWYCRLASWRRSSGIAEATRSLMPVIVVAAQRALRIASSVASAVAAKGGYGVVGEHTNEHGVARRHGNAEFWRNQGGGTAAAG